MKWLRRELLLAAFVLSGCSFGGAASSTVDGQTVTAYGNGFYLYMDSGPQGQNIELGNKKLHITKTQISWKQEHLDLPLTWQRVDLKEDWNRVHVFVDGAPYHTIYF